MSRAAIYGLIADHDDIPAFRAGFFVLSLLCAALLNFGAFALLILAHMALDTVKYRDVHGYSWGVTVRGVVRESIQDMALLAIGLCMAMLLDPSLNFEYVAVTFHGKAVLVRAGSILFTKFIVLQRFTAILADPAAHMQSTNAALRQKWYFGEQSFVVLFFVLTAVLLLAPLLLPISDALYRHVLLQQMVPWKV
ncbi:MAG: hypothetical protein JWM56_1350 [Candidatus Peribacteria bacterium]|nr:hypothetical protein [Candidatus Peribacteria bacterium]